MQQYEQSGPAPEVAAKEDRESQSLINDLRQRVDAQDRRIDELERDLRRLRNDVRTAIFAANTISANRQRNG